MILGNNLFRNYYKVTSENKENRWSEAMDRQELIKADTKGEARRHQSLSRGNQADKTTIIRFIASSNSLFIAGCYFLYHSEILAIAKTKECLQLVT